MRRNLRWLCCVAGATCLLLGPCSSDSGQTIISTSATATPAATLKVTDTRESADTASSALPTEDVPGSTDAPIPLRNLTSDEAIAIALNEVPNALTHDVEKWELVRLDDTAVYEVTIHLDGDDRRYVVFVNAANGQVLEIDTKFLQ